MNTRDPRDPLEVDQIRLLIPSSLATACKLQAQQQKLMREFRWYPFIAIAAFAASVVAVAKLFFGA